MIGRYGLVIARLYARMVAAARRTRAARPVGRDGESITS